jgi:hypothetical protein
MPSPRLTRPIKPNGHTPLRTMDEACAYLIALPGQIATEEAWECAAVLALEARAHPTESALDEFTRQLELALFITHLLDLSADRSALDGLLERARKQRPAT